MNAVNINIDTVYQRVLTIINKEQRGYITPQEFNLIANQVQMDTFEQYFYDLDQYLRAPSNSTLHSDRVRIIEEKIELFHKSVTLVSTGEQASVISVDAGGNAVPHNNIYDLVTNTAYNDIVGTSLLSGDEVYRLYDVRYADTEIEKLPHKEWLLARESALTAPSLSRPVYYQKGSKLIVGPSSITDGIDINYIRRPNPVSWNYTVINGSPLYNPNSSIHFELHPSEEVDITLRILALCGVVLKDPNLYQLAGTEDSKNIQQEKQ